MLAIQKDLGHNLIVEEDYNGSKSDNLYLKTHVNRFPGDLITNKGNRSPRIFLMISYEHGPQRK